MDAKVALVDDDPDILFCVKAGLEFLLPGLNVFCFTSGREFLNIVESILPDIVFLDIMMPDLDGWAVVSELRKFSSCGDVPVVFLTCKTDELSKRLGGLMAYEYIMKPFDVKDLKKTIESVLGG